MNKVDEDVEIDPQYYGAIIGIKGANVREISFKHQVSIKFPVDQTSKLIRFKGLRSNVDAAKAAIYAIIISVDNEKVLSKNPPSPPI